MRLPMLSSVPYEEHSRYFDKLVGYMHDVLNGLHSFPESVQLLSPLGTRINSALEVCSAAA